MCFLWLLALRACEKKSTQKNLCERYHFFLLLALLLMSFLLVYSSTPILPRKKNFAPENGGKSGTSPVRQCLRPFISIIRLMCCIPATWHDSSIVNVSVEGFCQHTKKKKSCHCWKIVLVTADQSCQWMLNNRATDCWRIMPVTIQESCQPMLNNSASDCWAIVSVTVEELWQPMLNNRASDC